MNKNILIIIAVGLGLAMNYMDMTAIAVALPTIGREFHANMTQLHWVMNAMFLGMAIFVIAAGRLGDHWGHGRIFIVGTLGFLVTSLMAASAQGIAFLIGIRLLQGITTICIIVSSANVVMQHFPKHKHGTMTGLSMSLACLFAIIGPLVGGLLVHFASWRWIFVINIPLAIIILLCYFSSPKPDQNEDYQHIKQKWDWLGFILVIILLATLTIVIMEFSNNLSTYLLLTISALTLICLYKTESKQVRPFLDFNLLKQPGIAVGCGILFLTQSLFFVIILWNIYFQTYLHFSPLQAGLIVIPFGVLVVISVVFSGKIYDRFGVKRPLKFGLRLTTIGFLQLPLMLPSFPLLSVLIAYGCLYFGGSFIAAPIRTYAIQSTASKDKGLVNAIVSSSRQTGGVLGLAVLSRLQQAGFEHGRLHGLSQHQSYFQGFYWSMFAATILIIVAFLLSFKIKHSGQNDPHAKATT